MHFFFKKQGLIMILLLPLILYCEQRHGEGKPLQDYSSEAVPAAPEWVKNGVMYQIFPRTFSESGDFNGIRDRLDHLESLGVNIIWLMPIFPIGEKDRKGTLGSPYAVKNFREINPDLGCEEDLKALIADIHRRGMKVILGMVPNHGANDNVLMKEHPDWFMRDEKGRFTREEKSWSDITDFNYANPHMRQYMRETLLYWIREFDFDGFRFDVAGMVEKEFWKETIPLLRKEKEDIYLLAEWEDPELLLCGFNSDYDWTLYHLLKNIRHGRNRSAEVVNLVAEKDGKYPQNAVPMRFLENHDEQRSLAVFGAPAIEAYARVLFTLPGLPLIYAGQEFGDIGSPDWMKFEPYTLKWEQFDSTLFRMYRDLVHLRRHSGALTAGEFVPLSVATAKGSAMAYFRLSPDEVFLVVSNLKSKPAEKVIVSMPDNVLKQFTDVEFKIWPEGETSVRANNLYFPKINAFSTLIFRIKLK
ncbi:MAG: hypothetical protein Kow0037_02300 [Calditrichia bacterium]